VGARSEQLKGTRFGAYEVVRLVGHGATASVFEATHVSLDKPVAIKLLHEHLAADVQVTSRFLREGRVAARLQHPNIVNVLDVGTDQGVPYLVMELLSGSDLRALLADVGSLSVEHALGFLLPILSALVHAHAAGVVHRDLKPANIFLARDAREIVVPKLVDFGLSKLATAGGELSSALTATGLIAGTVLYMAPEQTFGVRNSSPASDQYSLAAILYEAITGLPPFQGDGVYALLDEIRSAAIRPPSALKAGIPEGFDAVVLRAMDRDPAKRWPSVRTFGRELLRFAGPTAGPFERDFADRTSEPKTSASLLPSGRRVAARSAPEVETRLEDPAPSLTRETGSATRRIAPLPCPAGSGPFHIKGLHYRSFMFHVSRTVGLEAFLEKLEDESLVKFVSQPFLASRRYDIFPFVPLFATLAGVLGLSLDTLIRTSTAAQVRYDAKTAYKLILDANRPEDIADRVGRFNSHIYDFGKYSALVPDKNHVTIVFEQIPAYLEPWFESMHVVYAIESLRLSGASDVVVVSHQGEKAGTSSGYPLRTYRTTLRWNPEPRAVSA
jgi:serine/threonine protein kinase